MSGKVSRTTFTDVSVNVLGFQLSCPKDRYDIYKCDALLANGRWLDDKYQNWQPPGCMMHNYQEHDLVSCLKHQRLVFLGDSSVRQLYRATARKFGIEEHSKAEHSDLAFHIHDVTVEFRWDPFLNSSNLTMELTTAARSRQGLKMARSTAALVIGGGLWHARYLDEANYFDHYKGSLESIAQSLDHLGPKNAGGPLHRYSFGPLDTHGFVLLNPVPVPFYDQLSLERAATITPAKIDALNLYLYQNSAAGNITVPWSLSSMISPDGSSYQPDGIHFTDNLASRMVDVILNLRCNVELRIANRQRGYPMDKTCCNRYNPPRWPQFIMMGVFVWLLPFVILMASTESSRVPFLPSWKITRAITVLAFGISYCYYADRTPLFNKTQKQYMDKEFMSLCAVVMVLGVVSIRRSVIGHYNSSSSQQAMGKTDQYALSRQQTDEWKGWMQFIILIYHYTGASKILRIYEIIRLLVASYIFLSGFGHSVYFYRKADYSFRRCATVLIRLNLLTCALPYMMGTDYLFYYFAPLISFWFMVTYATMAVGHSRNKSFNFLVVKVLLSAGLVNLFIVKGPFFELLFYFLEKTCKIGWNLFEWRFRVQLDGYVTFTGMLCGILFVRMTDDSYSETPESKKLRRLFREFRWMGVMYAVAAFMLCWWLACDAASKYTYNRWFPYVSTFPILGFVILRNFNRHLRNFNSSIFAWMGRQSLETFTLQYHVWLAADTKGLLALGIFERMTGDADIARKADFVVLTIVFLWISWHIAAATQTLTTWIVDPRNGRENSGRIESANGDMQLSQLPRNRSNDNMRDEQSHERDVTSRASTGAIRSTSRVKKLVAGDLRVRIGLLLAVMWLLNAIDHKQRQGG